MWSVDIIIEGELLEFSFGFNEAGISFCKLLQNDRIVKRLIFQISVATNDGIGFASLK